MLQILTETFLFTTKSEPQRLGDNFAEISLGGFPVTSGHFRWNYFLSGWTLFGFGPGKKTRWKKIRLSQQRNRERWTLSRCFCMTRFRDDMCEQHFPCHDDTLGQTDANRKFLRRLIWAAYEDAREWERVGEREINVRESETKKELAKEFRRDKEK